MLGLFIEVTSPSARSSLGGKYRPQKVERIPGIRGAIFSDHPVKLLEIFPPRPFFA